MRNLILLLGVFFFAGCSAPEKTIYRVNAEKGLVVRSEASASSAKLGVLPDGSEVAVDTIDGEWASIGYQSATGYVAAQYLEPLHTVHESPHSFWTDMLIFAGGVMLALITGLLLYLHIRADEQMNEWASGLWLLAAGVFNLAPMLFFSRFNETFAYFIDHNAVGWVAAVVCMLLLLVVWFVPCMTVWKLIAGVFSSDQVWVVRVLAVPLALANLIVCILFLLMGINLMVDIGLYMLLVYLCALPLLGVISAICGGDILSAQTVRGKDGHTYHKVVRHGRNAASSTDYVVKGDRSGSVYKRTK